MRVSHSPVSVPSSDWELREGAASVCARIVCSLDSSPASLEAARQSVRLCAPGGSLELVAVLHPAVVTVDGWAMTIAARLGAEAEAAFRRAFSELGPLPWRLHNGPPVRCLLAELEREAATLLALGAPTYHRAAGLALGDVATTMLRTAPCSVLVARPPADPSRFPSRLVLGVDGSPQAAAAVAVARALRVRFGSELRILSALGGKSVDPDAVRRVVPDTMLDSRPPVDALVDASADADLVVVGSRGLHGLRALGSVSERVAHRAHSSVLVVRGSDRDDAARAVRAAELGCTCEEPATLKEAL